MPDMPEGPGGFRQTPDRRAHYRRTPGLLTYVEIGQQNGGIVLNISEGGVAITAAEILADQHFPHIRFQLPQTDHWVEGSAQIVWISASRKEAGIQFVDLPDAARLCIEEWVGTDGVAHEFSSERPIKTSSEKRKQFLEMPSPRKGKIAPAERATSSQVVSEELEALFPSESSIAEKREEQARAAAKREEIRREQAQEEAKREEARREEQEREKAAEQAHREREKLRADVPAAAASVVAPDSHHASVAVEGKLPAAGPARPPQLQPFAHSNAVARPTGEPILHLGWQPGQVPVEPYVDRRSAAKNILLVCVIVAVGFAAGVGFAHGSLAQLWADAQRPFLGDRAENNIQQAPAPSAAASDASGKSFSQNTAAPATTNSAPLANAPTETSGSSAAGSAPPAASAPSSATPTNVAPVASADGSGAASPAQGNDSSPDLDVAAGETNSSANQFSTPILVDAPAPGSPPVAVNLPEEAVSASGYVAISDRRTVYVPSGNSPQVRMLLGALMFHAEPVYPAEARQRNVEGTVELHATVNENGEVIRVLPLRGPTLLIPAAVNAVREWQYKPTLLNGQPVATQEDITIAFRLP